MKPSPAPVTSGQSTAWPVRGILTPVGPHSMSPVGATLPSAISVVPDRSSAKAITALPSASTVRSQLDVHCYERSATIRPLSGRSRETGTSAIDPMAQVGRLVRDSDGPGRPRAEWLPSRSVGLHYCVAGKLRVDSTCRIRSWLAWSALLVLASPEKLVVCSSLLI
jgi:hypothetical protein